MNSLNDLITAAAEQLNGATDNDSRIKILRELTDRVATRQQVIDSNKLRQEAERVQRAASGENGMANVYSTALSTIIQRCADLVGRN